MASQLAYEDYDEIIIQSNCIEMTMKCALTLDPAQHVDFHSSSLFSSMKMQKKNIYIKGINNNHGMAPLLRH